MLKSKTEILESTIIWLKNLFQSAISGGASAAIAAFGLVGANSIGVTVTPLDYKQTGAVFLSGTIFEVLRYLKTKPTPDIEEPEQQQGQK